MKSKQIELKDFIKENRRKVKLKNLNAKQGFTFEDDKLLAIRKKIEAAGVPLGEIGISISRGVEYGKNELFVKKKGELKSSRDIINTCVKGINIKSYYYTEELECVNLFKGSIQKIYGNTDNFYRVEKELLQKIKQNADEIGYDMENRKQRGETLYDTKYDYKSTAGAALMACVSLKFNLVYVDEDITVLSPNMVLRGKGIKSVIAVLNSNIGNKMYDRFYAENYLENRGSKRGEGSLRRIPIVIDSRLDKYVDQIQNLKKQGKPTDHLEAEVEKIVQELYGLTDEEVEYLCR